MGERTKNPLSLSQTLDMITDAKVLDSISSGPTCQQCGSGLSTTPEGYNYCIPCSRRRSDRALLEDYTAS